MGSLPFAFSVHHFINSVGSDAGFASIIGLAILILLYFAQARETSSLRNHAQEAAQRIQDLEARLAQVGRPQAQAPVVTDQRQQAVQGQSPHPAAARAAAVAAPAAARMAAVGAPVAPAGVGAPALAAATRLIPTPPPAAAPVALAPQPPDATVIGSAGTVSPPATVAGGANGTDQVQAPPPSRPVAAPAVAQAPPPRIQMRPSGTVPPGRRPVTPSRSQPPRSGRSVRAGRILLALIGVLALGAVIAGLLLLTGGSSNSPKAASSPTRTTNAPGRRHRARATGVAPSSVTVAVLNGTATSGLAHRVALKLSSAGYKEGMVATATDQTKTTTTIAYLPGFRREALAVASSLKLGPASVAPVDPATQTVACPPPTPCAANVVATVGSDLANTQ